MIDQLVNSNDQEVKSLRQNLNFHIVPVVNPDGYEYTRSSPNNRMWRMTRSKNPGQKCLGVDGNRNYEYHWGGKEVNISNDQ